ncbi:MAG: TMEM165/GDT1 family protein [Cyanobacteria bacterium]|nr:TMEM165/GDT1 family protein [Cyanobacteria bacterium bin.51]
MASDPALAAFGSSFTAITLAELGDKTFFVAMLLAARHRGRWVFIGAFSALAAVTLISLALGYGLRELLPTALVPWLAALLFGGFGLKLLIDAQAMGEGAAEQEAIEAEALVNRAEDRRISLSSLAVVRESFVLVFLAELGDRTQFATIALATAPAFTFSGLLAGTLAGHGLVTGLAVGAGKWIGRRLQERLLFRLSGGLFLCFALFAIKQALA